MGGVKFDEKIVYCNIKSPLLDNNLLKKVTALFVNSFDGIALKKNPYFIIFAPLDILSAIFLFAL